MLASASSPSSGQRPPKSAQCPGHRIPHPALHVAHASGRGMRGRLSSLLAAEDTVSPADAPTAALPGSPTASHPARPPPLLATQATWLSRRETDAARGPQDRALTKHHLSTCVFIWCVRVQVCTHSAYAQFIRFVNADRRVVYLTYMFATVIHRLFCSLFFHLKL